ncbi:hypothetical protein GGR28_003743 [Lewinella aquimaris]|uniref:Uncharacterized protein n=1 Tax=Neolewinella aquimaris TaxID=1835722 RepID=A0A840EJP4_9BACT|nr:hypothetical protein [Neolewinella aquimaris]MBB4081096.1 hypothetical protein [Neolewinella aquimaris]
MTQSQQQSYRLFIPGVVVLLYVFALDKTLLTSYKIIENSIGDERTIVYSTYVIIASIIGAIYMIFKVRFAVWDMYLPVVQRHIIHRLLTFAGRKYDSLYFADIKNVKKVMNVFYQLIDNDNSLTTRSNTVRLNGLVWTSIMDLAVISLVVFGVVFTYGLVTLNSDFVLWSYFPSLIALLCLITLPVITNSHIEAGDKQLDYIGQHMKNELTIKLNEIL